MSSHKVKDSAYFYARPDVYGIEFIHAQFVTHRFARHVHDYVDQIVKGLSLHP
ncbi:MAG TPA: hypothetical protein VKQ72_13320 [Aggregatilineales bacterium]|nr:hypothetical protein [Aggregatilineales bacterium]